MKQLTLTFTIVFAVCAMGAFAIAGTERYAGKEVMQQAPAPCEWYRAHEWNLNVWGTIAFPSNTGHYNDFPEGDLFDGGTDNPQDEHFDIGAYSKDRLIARDNAMGGGADIKFFFNKYFGIGAEGFILDADNNIAGAGLGTVTFRFPIGCSRFAPYAWGGVGAIGGGSHKTRFFSEIHHPPGNEEGEQEFINNETVLNNHTLAIGQFGAGLEVRVTRHIGFMGDFAWNVVQEDHNDFGMARLGVTLSY